MNFPRKAKKKMTPPKKNEVTPHSVSPKKIGKNVGWQEYADHCLENDKLPEKKKRIRKR